MGLVHETACGLARLNALFAYKTDRDHATHAYLDDNLQDIPVDSQHSCIQEYEGEIGEDAGPEEGAAGAPIQIAVRFTQKALRAAWI
ncbi:hypothetical protein GCM10011499_20020 [Pelagibacterium lentulum]|uniref:Uncharacterized protein n=1 Tax=Pelagibacterium lentulum TaxID=2029865 RepID=A0A916RC33_9HYPH|nr:hypothetical protein GCM10011499_20020 [Pelagibacterium lentulum]